MAILSYGASEFDISGLLTRPRPRNAMSKITNDVRGKIVLVDHYGNLCDSMYLQAHNAYPLSVFIANLFGFYLTKS